MALEPENTQKMQSLAGPTTRHDAFRRTPNSSEPGIRQLCLETGLEEYQVSNCFQGDKDLWRNSIANGLTPETTCDNVLPSSRYSDPGSDVSSVQHTRGLSVRELRTDATGQQRI